MQSSLGTPLGECSAEFKKVKPWYYDLPKGEEEKRRFTGSSAEEKTPTRESKKKPRSNGRSQ